MGEGNSLHIAPLIDQSTMCNAAAIAFKTIESAQRLGGLRIVTDDDGKPIAVGVKITEDKSINYQEVIEVMKRDLALLDCADGAPYATSVIESIIRAIEKAVSLF